MPTCEKCWRDAFSISKDTGKSQAEVYRELLEKRKNNPCPQKQRREEEAAKPSKEVSNQNVRNGNPEGKMVEFFIWAKEQSK